MNHVSPPMNTTRLLLCVGLGFSSAPLVIVGLVRGEFVPELLVIPLVIVLVVGLLKIINPDRD